MFRINKYKGELKNVRFEINNKFDVEIIYFIVL